MATDSTVHTEDMIAVNSRISWGAIAAGAVLALSLYFLLTLLGAAVGFSISETVDAQNIRSSAVIYAIVITAISLFAGGYVASLLTVGENKSESILYGLLVWAVVFAMMVTLMTAGVRAGFNAMMGIATAGQVGTANTTSRDWEAAARQAGVPQERINEWRAQAQNAPNAARQAANDPQNQQAALDAATRVSWYSFFGVWISMMAAALGGYVGAGPMLRVFAVPVHTRTATTQPRAT